MESSVSVEKNAVKSGRVFGMMKNSGRRSGSEFNGVLIGEGKVAGFTAGAVKEKPVVRPA